MSPEPAFRCRIYSMDVTTWQLSLESALSIVMRTSVVYITILLGMRIFGKREIGQMAPFDLVLLLLISNAVQNAMVGSNNTLSGGLLAALILLLLNFAISRMRLRSARFRQLVEGTPTVLISQGKLIKENLSKEGIDEAQLQAALREHGVNEFSKVALAVLETDGMISILPTDVKMMKVRHQHKTIKHE